MPESRGSRRLHVLLFLLPFSAYAWFHQGGGWQQNARFDQVRALVETGVFSINGYVAYRPDLERAPVPLVFDPGTTMGATIHTQDLSYYAGRLYPNKPPGVTLLAAPGYALLRGLAGALGISPDGPRAVEVLGWLTSVLSVALLGAGTGLVFFRLGRRLFPSVPTDRRLAATLCLSLGTPFLPYATMLFDHVPVAALLLFAFERLVTAADEGATPGRLAAAGAAAALAVVTNYAALLGLGVLGVYAVMAIRPASRLCWAMLATVPFAVFLLAYHAMCFGSPFVVANAFQFTVFRDPSGEGFLSVFTGPDPRVGAALLFSRYRGLFTVSPVLVLAFVGALAALRGGRRREIATALSLFLAYLGMNAAFNAWHGGFAFGPRYLVPAVPFVALGLVPAFARWPRTTTATAAVSIVLCVAATAIDPLPPQDAQRPWHDFLLPLARGEVLHRTEAVYHGPVSANLGGMGAPQRRDPRNAFNVGESLFPESWGSLAPLLALQGIGWLALFRAGRQPARRNGAPS